MGIDPQVVQDFRGVIKQDIPKFEVKTKDRSGLMKVMGFLLRPFNAEFMTRFTTTIGNTVYFPSAEWYELNPDRVLRVMAHEYVHLWDNKEHSLFKLSYLFPQILVVLPMIAFMILAWPWSWLVLAPVVVYLLACLIALASRPVSLMFLGLSLIGFGVGAWFLVGWPLFVLLGGLVFLIPWPAPWRTKWELRGYSMNVAFAVWFGYWSEEMLSRVAPHFTGPNYYFMCWSGSKIRSALTQAAEAAKAGKLQEDHPYKAVHDFLYQRSLLRR